MVGDDPWVNGCPESVAHSSGLEYTGCNGGVYASPLLALQLGAWLGVRRGLRVACLITGSAVAWFQSCELGVWRGMRLRSCE
jgi:hypothetical protein